MICRDISGVILAGGENKRFGGSVKSNIVIGGEKIIDRIIRTLNSIFEELIIVTNTMEKFKTPGNIIYTEDFIKGAGPLGGIHAAMRSSSYNSIFVFAGDMPYLNRSLVIKQAGFFNDHHSAGAVVPVHKDGIEPLHSIYSCSLHGMLEEHLRNTTDYNIRRFLEKIEVVYFKPEGQGRALKAFTNINTPGEAELENLKSS